MVENIAKRLHLLLDQHIFNPRQLLFHTFAHLFQRFNLSMFSHPFQPPIDLFCSRADFVDRRLSLRHFGMPSLHLGKLIRKLLVRHLHTRIFDQVERLGV